MKRFSGVLLALLLVGLVPLLMAASSDQAKATAVAKYALELDGTMAGWLSSFEGGQATGEVVTEEFGADFLAKKHIGSVKYEDITITFGVGMSSDVYDWIVGMLNGDFIRHDGAIIGVDSAGNERMRLEFVSALITEIGMPALDAASKDAAKMTIKFKPEETKRQAGSGGKLGLAALDAKTQKKWLPANFRLTIDGVGDATKKVNKIEALVIKQKVTESAVGEERDFATEPTSVEIPNLVITFPEADSQTFYDWHEDFVIKGNNGDDAEKSGMLEYLSSDLKTVLFTLNFFNLGIFKVDNTKPESARDTVRRVKAEMYVEAVEFSYSPATITK
jgi:phage tail-like protein